MVNALRIWFIQERTVGTQISGTILKVTLTAYFKVLGIKKKKTTNNNRSKTNSAKAALQINLILISRIDT